MVGLSLGFYNILSKFAERERKQPGSTHQSTREFSFYGVINKETFDVNPNGESAICQHIWTIMIFLSIRF